MWKTCGLWLGCWLLYLCDRAWNDIQRLFLQSQPCQTLLLSHEGCCEAVLSRQWTHRIHCNSNLSVRLDGYLSAHYPHLHFHSFHCSQDPFSWGQAEGLFYLCVPPHSGHHPLWFCIYCLSEARSIRGRWHTQQSPTLSLLLSSALSFSASGIRTWRMLSERPLERNFLNNLVSSLHNWVFTDVSEAFTLKYLEKLFHRGWHKGIKCLRLGPESWQVYS